MDERSKFLELIDSNIDKYGYHVTIFFPAESPSSGTLRHEDFIIHLSLGLFPLALKKIISL